jgi:single-strand DNA-binding protein
MGAMNRVFLMGNLTRVPEVRRTATGLAVSDLGLAVSERFKGKDGDVVERTCFADIVVWGRQAETCAEFLGKGSPILVEGSLVFEQWETEKGEKRSRLKVKADRIQFLGKSLKGTGSGDGAGEAGGDGAGKGVSKSARQADLAVAEVVGEEKYPF